MIEHGSGTPNEPRDKATDEPGGRTPEKVHIWDRPENVSRFLRVFYSLCVVLVLLDFVVHRHVAHPWERFTAFYGFYGFVSCWTLVVVAKLMRKVLMRGEDYYDVD